MSMRNGFKITGRDLRIAKLGKKQNQGLCAREFDAYLTAIGKHGSESLIPAEIILALTNCINAKVRDLMHVF